MNLFDLDRISEEIRVTLFVGNLDLQQTLKLDKDRPDEVGVAFSCDLLRAATICDVLRNHDRLVKEYPTRLYICREKSWSKIPGELVLTRLTTTGGVELDPGIFPPSLAEGVPLPPKRLY